MLIMKIARHTHTGLRGVEVDVVTFGQYMRPTKGHMKVARYVDPLEFDKWREVAEGLGFLYVASGPLVRSSYKVREREGCEWSFFFWVFGKLLSGGPRLIRCFTTGWGILH